MRFLFSGTDSNFFENALLSPNLDGDFPNVNEINLFNLDNNYTTQFLGTRFDLPNPTLTAINFNQNGLQASMLDFQADFFEVVDAIDAALLGNISPLANLIEDDGPLTIDASPARGGLDIEPSFGGILRSFERTVTITGSRFDDLLTGGLRNDTIDGGDGQDVFFIDVARDMAEITQIANGLTITTASHGTDVIRNVETFQFTDAILSRDAALNPQALSLTGDDIADELTGGAGADMLAGGRGDDRLKGGGGSDSITGDAGDDFLKGGTDFDELFGSAGNDILSGNRGDDRLYGDEGNDILRGGARNDLLIGGAGNDTLKGGADNDDLFGEGGADVFVFDQGSAHDRIYDFDITEDRLVLSAALANGASGAEIETGLARIVVGNVEIDFGSGDIITLVNLTTTEGLADVIFFI